MDAEKSPHHHHKETHGLRSDIDDSTPLSDVKAPNVFERAKEEIEALIQTIHPKKESQSHEKSDQSTEASSKAEHSNSSSASNDVKSPNFIKRAKEELEEFIHHKASPKHHHHHKETQGTSSDIDENTPVSEVKGPNVFERAKEEIEALVQTIHHKKELAIRQREKAVSGTTWERGWRRYVPRLVTRRNDIYFALSNSR